MKYIAALALAVTHSFGLCADNLEKFAPQKAPHPICGVNPAFDGQPRNIPLLPFNICRTLAVGYQAEDQYSDPGIDALGKFIVAMGNAGTWEQRFRELSPPLMCRPAMPLGFGNPGGNLPICTVEFINNFYRDFKETPAIADYIALERKIKGLDLSRQSTIEKLKQATAVIRATGQSISFKEMRELLD